MAKVFVGHLVQHAAHVALEPAGGRTRGGCKGEAVDVDWCNWHTLLLDALFSMLHTMHCKSCRTEIGGGIKGGMQEGSCESRNSPNDGSTHWACRSGHCIHMTLNRTCGTEMKGRAKEVCKSDTKLLLGTGREGRGKQPASATLCRFMFQHLVRNTYTLHTHTPFTCL